MADKKDTLGGLNEAVETLNKDNHKDSIQSSQILGNIDATMKDIYSINSQMLETMSAIQQSLAPDAFGAAQATETTREGAGAPIVGGPADASTVAPAEGKKGMGMLGMLGVAAAGAAAGLVAAFAGFLDFDAEKVRDKVIVLTSISDHVDAADTAETVATLGALGAGLAIFGIGSAIAGLSSALTNFTDPTWAQSIVDNVSTLVGIADIPFGDVAKTTASLSTLAVGLAIFGVGSSVAGLASAITNFSDPMWAQTIVDNVYTLVEISEIPFGDIVKMTAGLTAIGAGLAIFGVGSAIAGMGEAVAKFSGGTDWTQTIKNNVITLASISDEVSPEKAASFSEAMGSIAAGLMKFAGGNFVSSLLDAGAKLMNFLTGGESPIEQMMKIAENSYDLEVGAASLERIQSALGGLSSLNFDGSNLNLKEFAEDLVEAVPAIEKAIMGGKIDGGLFFGDDIEFKGLASPDIDFESAIARMAQLRSALGAGSSMQGRPAQGQGADFDPELTGGVVGATGAAVPVPTDTASGITGGGGDMQVVEAEGVTLPYNTKEKHKRARQLARALGLGSARSATFEAGIPTTVDGVEVPTYLYTDEEIDHINASRDVRAAMNNTTPTFIPTRQSGDGLQAAQAEANTNNNANGGGNAIVQQNIAPNTVNNASNTNIATRNEHHSAARNQLMAYGEF